MTMANSIEGRVPFTDIEVFKLARTISYDHKITKENTKVALREAAKRDIPTDAYKKEKLGFPVPLREWVREDAVYNMIKDPVHPAGWYYRSCHTHFGSPDILQGAA